MSMNPAYPCFLEAISKDKTNVQNAMKFGDVRDC